MIALLAFTDILLLAVLVSDRTHRSVLSTAVLFLAGGFASSATACSVRSTSTGQGFPDRP